MKAHAFKGRMILHSFVALSVTTSGCALRAGGAGEQSALEQLGDTSWRLVEFAGSDDTTLRPAEGRAYTISFGRDGSVRMRVDCNSGRGTWMSPGPQQLQFGPIALTRVGCPSPLSDHIARDFEYVRTYTLQNGHLYLDLLADGGTYEFEPIAGAGD